MTKPLSGIKIIEMEGIGPGPFCGQFLRELGAEVTLIKRPGSGFLDTGGNNDPIHRGKAVLALNMKVEADRETLKAEVAKADALIEGMRPGVMERLGLGPADLAPHNPALVYGRITGWGQDGPLSQAAGHDINYAALSGALWYSGQAGTPPLAPPTMLGDIGGGALYLTIGLLAALMQAKQKGQGQVVDAAMVDGSAHMMNLLLSAAKIGAIAEPRGTSLLDGANWYGTYECKDGGYVTLGAIEPQFYAELIEKMGLSDDPDYAQQFDFKRWPELREKFKEIFLTKTRDEWCDILEGTDACFAPVLPPSEAAKHPHMAARGVYSDESGILLAAPAPRFKPLK